MRRAFTLVELLIVIVIIAILAAIGVPYFANAVSDSKASRQAADIKLLTDAVDRFKGDTQAYPMHARDLIAINPPATGLAADGSTVSIDATSFKGPYLNYVPTDPVTGDRYRYGVRPPYVGVVKLPPQPNSGDLSSLALDATD